MFRQRDDGNIYPKKKKSGPLGYILLGILLLAVIFYIIYAINLPEPQPFEGVTTASMTAAATATAEESPLPPADAAGVHYSLTGESGTNAVQSDAAAADTAPIDHENPVADALETFDDRWEYALQTMAELRALKDLSYAFPVMDIAHADMMRDMNSLASLSVSQDQVGSDGGYLRPIAASPGSYEFQLTGQSGLPVRGQIDQNSQSMYYVEEAADGSTHRYWEVLQSTGTTYAQLMSSDGPYAGVLYYELTLNGDLRCAYLSLASFQEQGGEVTRHYPNAPESWETFIGSAVPYFSAQREEIVSAGMESASEEASASDSSSSSSSSSDSASSSRNSGARVAASTPDPNASSRSRQEEESDGLADLPEIGGDTLELEEESGDGGEEDLALD